MNRAAKTPLFVFLGSLAYAFSSEPAESQLAQEVSVPEPTQLRTVALADSSKLIRSESLGKIESADARATVTAIEVEERGGVRVRGVKILLEDSTSRDEVHITDSLLPNFRAELKELEFTKQFDDECQAKYRCIRGIARCRPSQTERQAYCPGRFSTPDSEQGFVLSTPRQSYSFPSVEPAQLDALISKGIQALE